MRLAYRSRRTAHLTNACRQKLEWDFRRALQVAAVGIARACADKEKGGRKRRKEEGGLGGNELKKMVD